MQRDAPVLARLLVAERFGHRLLEGRLRRAVVIAGEQRRGRDDVVIGAEVDHDRRLRAQPGLHVLVCETRALERLVERGVHPVPEVLIAAERREAVREGEQVHLLAGGEVEVHRRDHLARGRNKLQKLLTRAAHQEEGGGCTASKDDQPRGDDREQATAAMARGRWHILGLGPQGVGMAEGQRPRGQAEAGRVPARRLGVRAVADPRVALLVGRGRALGRT
ncbi:MAG TPA: hypothetical protein VEM93_11415 [Actinomycetota bacterium]|nr:hypothetical protein [Actinomycetota bacterium]